MTYSDTHPSGRRSKLFKPKQDPIAYAASSRDKSTLEMVDQAVRHNEVVLAYQPVVQSNQNDRLAFHEGLIRVLDATGRVIPAGEFIDAVEASETGRIIDCLALEHGLKTMSETPGLRLAINMSARSIGYSRWNKTLQSGLDQDPTIAERLILEISEPSAMLVPELVVGFMNDLQRKGISFALDDFGAGFTSFKYLRDFFFDIVKIDGQFIRGIDSNPDNQVIAAAMVSVAQQFDLITIAENVETLKEAQYLAGIGVDCLQGYCFGAPTVNPSWKKPARQKASA